MFCNHPTDCDRRGSRGQLLAALVLGLVLAGHGHATPLQELNPVGSASLKVFLWTIYDSCLYSEDGNFNGIEPDLALEITYRRSIKSEDLIDRTRKEWRKLSLYEPGHEQWLQQLRTLWPDVRYGDSLLLQVQDDLSSQFYLNGEPIGRMEDPQFTRSFLSIWLSEDSSYPDLRKQLVGLSG